MLSETGWAGFCKRRATEPLTAAKFTLPKGLTPEDLGFEVLTDDERDGLAESCIDFLAQEHERPFLLVASFINPHDICYMAIRDFAETGLEKTLVTS